MNGALQLFIISVVNNNHTHFSIFNKENIERDEDAEVEDVNIVLDGHLCVSQQRRENWIMFSTKQEL